MNVTRRLFSRPLTTVAPGATAGIERLCALAPVESVTLASQLARWSTWGTGDVVVLGHASQPAGAAWATGSLIPFGLARRDSAGHPGATRVQARALAEHARKRLTSQGSVFGPAGDVEMAWGYLDALGTRAREARWCQPLLQATRSGEATAARVVRRRPSTAWAAQGLRAARADQASLVLPASVAMFREEVGYDPTDSGSSYARHVDWMLEHRRTYVLWDNGAGAPPTPGSPIRVAFKADVGGLWKPATGQAVAQVTGVWTRPDLRGQGIGTAAMAATVRAIQAEHVGPGGIVSLYVNDFNEAALSLYRAVGFERVGTFATVLL